VLDEWRGRHEGEHLYIIGKGPSLRAFQPFDELAGATCFGINNAYKMFPHCSYVVMWHGELYWSDEDYLRDQKDFQLIYSSFHRLPPSLPNAVDVPYLAEFALPDSPQGTIEYWESHPNEWMYKATYQTAVKLCWWMGASRITMIGFDFSLENGRTADDSKLLVEVPLRKFTVPQVLALQAQGFEHLQGQLAARGIRLERIFNPSGLVR